MKRAMKLAVLAGVLLPATACGSQQAGNGAGPVPLVSAHQKGGTALPPTTSSPATPGPDGTDSPAAMRPNHVSPDARAVDLRPARFDRAQAGQGRELAVHYTVTGRPQCSVLGQVQVAESATDVRVTLMLGQQPGADCTGPQPQLAAVMVTTVTLREPLGSRHVHDGA